MKKLAGKGSMNQRIDVVLRKFRSRLNSYPLCPHRQDRGGGSRPLRETGEFQGSGNRHDPGEGFIEIHCKDADRLGISNGERIIVRSRRGAIDATARVGRKVSEGETWMPFHFPDSPVNRITNAVFDEFARIPEYKVCAVQLEKMAGNKQYKRQLL